MNLSMLWNESFCFYKLAWNFRFLREVCIQKIIENLIYIFSICTGLKQKMYTEGIVYSSETLYETSV